MSNLKTDLKHQTYVYSAMSREIELGLVQKAQTGDRDAFAELWISSEPSVRRLLAKTMWSGYDLLDDCIQECALTAFSKIGSYDGSSSFTTWLCTIALRARVNLFRQSHGRSAKRRTVFVDRPEINDEPQTPPKQLDVQWRLLAEKLEAKLSKLERKVFSALRAEFDCTEIAQQLGIEEETVYQATRRIKNKAKRLFREKKTTEQTTAPPPAKKAMAKKM